MNWYSIWEEVLKPGIGTPWVLNAYVPNILFICIFNFSLRYFSLVLYGYFWVSPCPLKYSSGTYVLEFHIFFIFKL